MAARRTAAQKAASRRNLEKARAARKSKSGAAAAAAMTTAKNSRVGAGKGYFSPGGADDHLKAVNRALGGTRKPKPKAMPQKSLATKKWTVGGNGVPSSLGSDSPVKPNRTNQFASMMGTAAAAKKRAFARKPKGSSAQNKGSLAASRKRKKK